MIERFGEQKLTQDEARADLEKTQAFCKAQPGNHAYWAHLGHLYDVLDYPEKSLNAMRKAYELNPNSTNCLNYGTILNQFSRFDEADDLFKRAWEMEPDRKYLCNSYCETLIRNGNYLEGWALFDSIRESSRSVKLEGAVEWDGVASLKDKKVAIISEGGSGDVYLMWRYVPLIAEMGALLSIITFDHQCELLGCQKWAIESRGAHYPFDYWISTFSFPAKFKTTVETIPWTGPYMNSQAERREYYRKQLERYPRPWVGLCWNAGEILDPRKYRSLTERQARRLLSFTGCTWVNIQHQQAPLSKNVVDLECAGWFDTAAILDNLDVFISVDTGVMNLAGGMGINVWTCLGGWYDCKFARGDVCPWYPTMTMFKNKAVGFDRSVESCRRALQAYCEGFDDRGQVVGQRGSDCEQRSVLPEVSAD